MPGKGKLRKMAEEDEPVTRRPTPGYPTDTDPRDDWLAASDADDLEWFEPDDGRSSTVVIPGSQVRGRGHSSGSGRTTGPVPVGASDLLRRRGVAIAILIAVVIAVVVAIVAFGGSGGSSTPPTTPISTTPPVTTTTPPATTPANTTPATTTPSTTTPSNPSSSSLTVTLPAAGHLKTGDTGPQVATVQKALTTLGVAQLTADGNYGPQTVTAVSAFQQAHGLTVDGVVGAETAAAINQALKAQA